MTNYFFNRYRLSNGIDVYVNSTPQFITTSMSLELHTPLTEDSSKTSLLPKVLLRGSKNYPTFRDMNSKLSDLKGAGISASVSKHAHLQSLSFNLQAITNPVFPGEESPFDVSLEMLEDIIKNPYVEDGVFSKNYVQQEKENLKRNILELKNDKKAYSAERLHQELYPNNAFGQSCDGTLESIDKINEESLYQHYPKLFSQSNAKIFITGSKTEEEYLKQLEKHFSNIHYGRSLETMMIHKPDYRLDFCREFNRS